MAKRNILIVHGYSNYPLRSSVRDLLFCYRRYLKDDRVFYLNLYKEFSIPGYIKGIDFDIIIFHTVFLSGKWSGIDFFRKNLIQKASLFSNSKAIKAMLPQDEWIYTKSLVDFINEIKIDHVFSVAASSEWGKIYKGVDFDKVKFHEVLTGYIDDNSIEKIRKFKDENSKRPIDIGYRAFKSPPWLGKHGYLKTKIADVFKQAGPEAGFKIDISTESSDTIIGDAWYKFLSRCKYFIGVEGGSTVLDQEGIIWRKGSQYINDHPDATFEEIEAACFPGLDGMLQLIAISPRHLEACQTGTCQVLVEGRYNGVLKPMEHYIPVKKDFSNLDSVFKLMKDDVLRKQISERAYEDIVASGKYNYSSFSREVADNCLLADQKRQEKFYVRLTTSALLVINTFLERIRWILYDYYLNSRLLYNIREYIKFNLLIRIRGRAGKIRNAFR